MSNDNKLSATEKTEIFDINYPLFENCLLCYDGIFLANVYFFMYVHVIFIVD